MKIRTWIFAACIGLSVPALAVGFDKLELFRAINLEEGEWVTTLTIEHLEVSPNGTDELPPDVNTRINERLDRVGRTCETTDCIGNRLGPKNELILPGFAAAANCTVINQSVSPDAFSISVNCGEQFKVETTYDATKTGRSVKGTVRAQSYSRNFSTEMRILVESKWMGVCAARQ